jgi:hypothetical protein
MTPQDWAEVFEAGTHAIGSRDESAPKALAAALDAMARKCRELARRYAEGELS